MERTLAETIAEFGDAIEGLVEHAHSVVLEVLRCMVFTGTAEKRDDNRTYELSDGSYIVDVVDGFRAEDFDWLYNYERIVAKFVRAGFVVAHGNPFWDMDEICTTLMMNGETVTVMRRVGERAVRII